MAPLLRSSPTCPVSDGLLTVCSQLTHGGRDFVVFTTTPSIVMGLNIPLEERKEISIPQAKYSGYYWEIFFFVVEV